MTDAFNRIWINRKYVIKSAAGGVSASFALLGFVALFLPLDGFFKCNTMVQRILACILLTGAVCLFWLLACSVYVLKKRRIKLFALNDGHGVYVQYGDVLNKKEVLKPQERRNIVIPVNRCFDTLVDNDLISENTLHGKVMKKLYAKNRFTRETLDDAIQKSLQGKNLQTETVPPEEKPKGNLLRYPVGTVAEVRVSNTCTFFFLALSTFDQNLHAHTSEEDYVLALCRLLRFCNTRSQGCPVVMPLIGGGGSNVRRSEKDILEYIIKFFTMNRFQINCDLHIVVRENGRAEVAITDL